MKIVVFKNLLLSLGLVGLLFMGIGCDDEDDTPTGPFNIAETLRNDSDYSSLVAALEKANLISTFEGSGSFTLFAPTNAAFSTFLSDNSFATLDDVPTDLLTQVLLNHVVGAKALSTDLTTGYVNTLAEEATTSSNLSAYVDLTSGVKLNGGPMVSEADIEATNGVIHEVDAVIGLPTVVTHALANPDFSILVAALTRSDLTTDYVGVLSGDGPFTVFAPANSAFEALLASNPDWNALEDIPVATLEAVLNYHVVAGANVRSTDLSDGQTVTALSEGTFQINIDGSSVTITDANDRTINIVATDVQGNNGVVHAIDAVLLP